MTFCVKESEPGATATVAVGVMVRVTATVWGLLAALAAVIVSVPVKVPTGSPAGFTVTSSLAGVAPADKVATSQEVLPVGGERVSAVPSVLRRDTDWNAGGLLDPNGAVNFSEPGLTTSNAELLTTSLTGMVCGLLPAPAALTVMDPS